ncbi:MAG: hypothetical protein OXT67_05495 [Zetaproteobacteria bacterium]|nr:hypothetical protein [Zetaproteobacteria bacterium]
MKVTVRTLTLGWLLLAAPLFAQLPDNYRQLSGVEKQKALWTEILRTPWRATPESTLPALDGAGWGNIWTKLGAAFTLGKSFDHPADELPEGREKIIHKYGNTFPFTWMGEPGHNYTGLYRATVPGVGRLSLASDPTGGSYTPGAAFKLLPDHAESVNFVVMHSVNGQGDDWNFFAKEFSTWIPPAKGWMLKLVELVFARAKKEPNRVGISRLAKIQQDGSEAAQPISPDHLILVPTASVANLIHSESREDFRDQLATIPAGTEIYEVYAVEATGQFRTLVAKIITEAEMLPSRYGDKQLFFRHQRQ